MVNSLPHIIIVIVIVFNKVISHFSKQRPGRFDVRGPQPGGTMSAEMDALAVVNQLRDLAADPLNRRAIVEDQGCLPGLILFLDHPNPQVVYSALLVRHFKNRNGP